MLIIINIGIIIIIIIIIIIQAKAIRNLTTPSEDKYYIT